MDVLTASKKNSFNLSLQILTLAREGLSRYEFKKRTACLFLKYSGSNCINIYVQDGPYRNLWRAEKNEGSFNFSAIHAEKEKNSFRTYWLETFRKNPEAVKGTITLEGRDFLTIPFKIDSHQNGFVAIQKGDRGHPPEELEVYTFLVEIIGTAIFYRNTHAALKE